MLSSQVIRAVEKITICEKNEIIKRENLSFKIFYSLISVASACYLLIFYVIILVDKRLNLIWTKFITRMKEVSPNLKSSAITRLELIHNYIYVDSIEESKSKNKIHKKNYILKYSLITCFLIIIPIVFLILFSKLYFAEVSKALTFRKDFIEIPINRRICAIKLCYNSMEKLSKEYQMAAQCEGYSNHASLQIELVIIANELKRLRDRFYEKDIFNNLPSASWQIIFAKIDNDVYFTQHGISSALAYLKHEAFNFGFNPKLYTFKDLRLFFHDCLEMSKCSSLIIDRNENITQNMINEKYSEYLIFICMFALLCVAAPVFLIRNGLHEDLEVIECIGEGLKGFGNLEKDKSLNLG